MAGEPLSVLGACHHDCPDTCAWEVTVEDGVATRLRGSPSHPVTRGSLCPKVNRYLDRVYHPDRVLTPLRRVGAKGSRDFEEITWGDAIEIIARRVRERLDQGRPESIVQFSFAGTQGLVQMGETIDRLFDLIGATDIRRELCGVSAFRGAARVLGTPYSIDPESMRQARTIVLWGTDTRMTNRHLWPTIEAARHAGATIIAIDPIRTETARAADVHLQPRPGTDVALVLGIVHVLDRDGLIDAEWIDERTSGWAELAASASEWTPERADEMCGLPDGTVAWLAPLLATQTPTAFRTLIGPEHRRGGEEILRAVTMLAAALGSWQNFGGGLARSTAAWPETALAGTPRIPRPAFNMARLGEVLTEEDPFADTLVVHNCNPAVIVPDQNRVIDGLSREDLFTVVIDQFITDTAAYADIVLPATTQVEQLDLAPSWGHMYLALNRPAIEPRGQALPNSEIARRLGAALGLEDEWLYRSDEQVIRDALASGHPLLEGITYESLSERGWQRLAVPAGARLYIDEIPGVANERMRLGALDVEPAAAAHSPEVDPRYPLTLISRKQVRTFLNSQYGGFADHRPPVGEPLLQIHAEDAHARGIRAGDRVDVRNERGELTLTAQISDQLQPGLVAIPFGWWNDSTPQGRSVNALTNAAVGRGDRGSAYFHDTYVEVTPHP
jgi:anaerobic selenocysteine-containing dehydrogenase